jgi:hypothetical protein
LYWKKEKDKPQNSRLKEIINIRAEISEMETKGLIQRINETNCNLPRCPSTKKWKQDVMHVNNEVLLSHVKSETLSFAGK